MSKIFGGLGTAVITPFKNGGEIDHGSFERLIEFQIKGGVDYIVIAGTTGEGATIDDEELYELLKFSKEKVKGRVKVVAGTGSNNTKALVQKIKKLNSLNADGYLVVSPFYNKPTQDGLLAHYSEVSAAAGNIPIILYNVPGRTGGFIAPETVARLAEKHKNIVAIKEASGNMEFAMSVYKKVSERTPNFTFLSGDDASTLPLIAVGYDGLISVCGNEVPSQMKQLVDAALNGDLAKARKINYELLDLIKANFVETNPGPIKYALKRMGYCDGSVRLPLSEFKNTKEFDEVFKKFL
jgi:4-hydroxy-tetrahydrodipicolinate synthase